MSEHVWERWSLGSYICRRCNRALIGWAMSGCEPCMTDEDRLREAESYCLDYPGTAEGTKS